MNKVFLIGNLTRDPELTTTPSGVSVCRFSIAVTRMYTGADGERKTDFFNIVAWRGLGENVAKYTKKGKKVAVTGSIEIRNYEDSTGAKRTAVEIVAHDIEFLSPMEAGENSGNTNKPVLEPYESNDDPFQPKPKQILFDDDDIPF